MRDSIVVLDFGSQYAHLIAKRFRMLGYYSEIALPSAPVSAFENAKGIVMSGGPSSVYEEKVPEFNSEILNLPIPILGLCYGHQLMAKEYGGEVSKAEVGEFGIAHLTTENCPESPLLKNIEMPTQVWMSHQDSVTKLAPGFEKAGFTKDCTFAAVQDLQRKRFGLQCHVEVKDTPEGNKIFQNFADYCGMEKNWSQDTVLDVILSQIKEDAKDKKVLLFLSGGVDSTVAFALLNKALGQERVLGLHIDNGFMRKNESNIIAQRYTHFGFNNFIVEDASASFLEAVYKETDPQKKRHAIGEHFITVRNQVVEAQKLDDSQWLLAQGTLYPDIIESGGTKNSHTIKTHHNRVEGIQALIAKGLIIEPLKDLYKDEVRMVGMKLGLSEELVMRHPFPGPGLSINVLCSNGVFTEDEELTKAKEELSKLDLDQYVPQIASLAAQEGKKAFTTSVLPVKSVGVQGDFRTYRFPAVLHFNAPDYVPDAFDGNGNMWKQLEEVSSYITNTLDSVNRTVVCFSEKEGCKLQEGYCEKNRLDQTREVDAIVLDELKKSGWYKKIFQHLTINLPYATQSNHCSIVLRPVVSEDVMTARFAHLHHFLLEQILNRIAKLDFVDAVYYDITNKPPATFGWE
jgi:GMP synthase (glutamine-hydrolysing)